LEIPIFQKVQNIELTLPNPLDRSLWRVQDYKDEMRKLKKTYAEAGDTFLSRCFKQVNLKFYFFLSNSHIFTGSYSR